MEKILTRIVHSVTFYVYSPSFFKADFETAEENDRCLFSGQDERQNIEIQNVKPVSKSQLKCDGTSAETRFRLNAFEM
jgi:hypothetical protein